MLIYKKYLKEQDEQTAITENNRYYGQLTLYLHDCPDIQAKMKHLEYEKNSLESLFQAYYSCVNSGMHFQKKTEKVSLQFGVLAGMSLTTLKFRGDESFVYLLHTKFSVSANFTAGVFLDLILARNLKKWSVCNELIYTSYMVNGSDFEQTSATAYATVNTTLGYGYLKMNNMIRYLYPFGKFSLFLDAGISNGFALSVKNYQSYSSTFGTLHDAEEGLALDKTKKWEFGFIGGGGARLYGFSLEARYEWGNGMSAYHNLSSKANRWYFLLGYSF